MSRLTQATTAMLASLAAAAAVALIVGGTASSVDEISSSHAAPQVDCSDTVHCM